MQNTLSVGKISEGFVLDHIEAGKSMEIYKYLHLDIGFIDHNITINIIQNEEIVEKKLLKLPKEIKNVIRCKNPRCITSIEQGLDHIFVLTDEENQVYRCKYCEEKYHRKN
ncbi:Aspartate carbamoyltransferase regulatory chain [Dorea longicatena]|nr:Aspartate carbamoyltransferase regulatory chain [Dorea longicatena]